MTLNDKIERFLLESHISYVRDEDIFIYYENFCSVRGLEDDTSCEKAVILLAGVIAELDGCKFPLTVIDSWHDDNTVGGIIVESNGF